MSNDYYFYNTDGGQRRFHILIENGIAVTGGPRKFGEELGNLAPGDVLLMYENALGVVAVGTVAERWNRRAYRTPKYYPRDGWDDNEYRIGVEWFLDLSDDSISLATLKRVIGYTPRGATQKIIKERAAVERLINERLSKNGQTRSLHGEDADTDTADEKNFRMRGEDRRRIVERQIRERRGQKQFRDKLLKRYGSRCLITKCEVLDVLEAAHIKPYRGDDDNHPGNGLLLRADIHTLFDLNLIGISPASLNVKLHSTIMDEYGHLNGTALACTANRRPSERALKLRYRQFERGLRES